MMGGKFPKEMALWLWLAFFCSFAVKTPMWPFHTWLPYAHVEASTAGSVILSGMLLKMGTYGFLRVSIQMLPEASKHFAPLVIWLSLIAIVYTSLVALAQTDMKKLIAYMSVTHMGFVTLGIFSFNDQGFDGAMMSMLSHTFVSAALFLCVGVVYDRLHTREISHYGGMATNMPRYAFVFMIFMLASIGLPGTSGFVGEFLSYARRVAGNSWYAFIAATGVVLVAAYMLWLYRRVFYGPLVKEDVRAMMDLNMREIAIFVPLLMLVLWIGIHPSTFRDVYAPTLEKILPITNRSRMDNRWRRPRRRRRLLMRLNMINPQSLIVMLPEIEVGVVRLVSLIAAAVCGARVTRHIGFLAITAFILAACLLFNPERLGYLLNGALPVFAFNTQFVDDSFARFVKFIIRRRWRCRSKQLN